MSSARHQAVLVLGGGLAGASAAIVLARAGREVVLLERERVARHKVCGEFLSHEAVGLLAFLGADVAALGAEPIGGLRVASRGKPVQVGLPFAAFSLTRRLLDEHLLACAEASGVRVLRGVQVHSLAPGEHGTWTACATDGASFVGRDVFLATGKHDVRTQPRPAGQQNDLVAFKMYFRLHQASARELAGHVELMLLPDGYAGLQPVEAGVANLCCVVRRETLRRVGASWDGVLAHMLQACPHLQQRLAAAVPELQQALAVSNIPYGMVQSRTQAGLWRIGDQCAVIPSFTGDGMSIALHSAVAAASACVRGEKAPHFQHHLAASLRAQVRLATALSQVMVTRWGQRAAQLGLPLWPGALRVIASRTRLATPPQAQPWPRTV